MDGWYQQRVDGRMQCWVGGWMGGWTQQCNHGAMGALGALDASGVSSYFLSLETASTRGLRFGFLAQVSRRK